MGAPAVRFFHGEPRTLADGTYPQAQRAAAVSFKVSGGVMTGSDEQAAEREDWRVAARGDAKCGGCGASGQLGADGESMTAPNGHLDLLATPAHYLRLGPAPRIG